jgi:hypothetical protein
MSSEIFVSSIQRGLIICVISFADCLTVPLNRKQLLRLTKYVWMCH